MNCYTPPLANTHSLDRHFYSFLDECQKASTCLTEQTRIEIPVPPNNQEAPSNYSSHSIPLTHHNPSVSYEKKLTSVQKLKKKNVLWKSRPKPWSAEEKKKVLQLREIYADNWDIISSKLNRTAKAVKVYYNRHLKQQDPLIPKNLIQSKELITRAKLKDRPWTEEDRSYLKQLCQEYEGNWPLIASRLRRTVTEVLIYYCSLLKIEQTQKAHNQSTVLNHYPSSQEKLNPPSNEELSETFNLIAQDQIDTLSFGPTEPYLSMLEIENLSQHNPSSFLGENLNI